MEIMEKGEKKERCLNVYARKERRKGMNDGRRERDGAKRKERLGPIAHILKHW